MNEIKRLSEVTAIELLVFFWCELCAPVLHVHVINVPLWMCSPLVFPLPPFLIVYFFTIGPTCLPFSFLSPFVFSSAFPHPLLYLRPLPLSFTPLTSLSGWTDSFQVFDVWGKCLLHPAPFPSSFLLLSTSSSSLMLQFPLIFWPQSHHILFRFPLLTFLHAHKFSPAGILCLWVKLCKFSNND